MKRPALPTAASAAFVLGLLLSGTGCDDENEDEPERPEQVQKSEEPADSSSTTGHPSPNERPDLLTPRERQQIKAAIETKLSRRVSFEFVDTPLEEALTFLNSLSKVGMIVDPNVSASAAGRMEITLKVEDMRMAKALELLLNRCGHIA